MRPGRPEDDPEDPPPEEALARCARPRSLVKGNTGRAIAVVVVVVACIVVVACVVVVVVLWSRRSLKKCSPVREVPKNTPYVL